MDWSWLYALPSAGILGGIAGVVTVLVAWRYVNKSHGPRREAAVGFMASGLLLVVSTIGIGAAEYGFFGQDMPWVVIGFAAFSALFLQVLVLLRCFQRRQLESW